MKAQSKILIGLPVFKRDWILPLWFECIEKQDFPLENIGFIFVLAEQEEDPNTWEVLQSWHNAHPEVSTFELITHTNKQSHNTHPGKDGIREWGMYKYLTMVELRNELIDKAAIHTEFDYFFSLDSDILLADPQTLNKLTTHIEGRDVISPLMYMAPYDTSYPSAMTWRFYGNQMSLCQAVREMGQIGEVFEVDIVMAAVMMNKHVFTDPNIGYMPHPQGEDLGFAWVLKQLGYKSYAAWDTYCPHIMGEDILADYIKTGIDGRNPF